MKKIWLVLFATAIGCGSGEDKKKDDAVPTAQPKGRANSIVMNPVQIKNGGVDTGKLENRLLAAPITVNGQVDVPPENLVSVSVPFGGFMKKANLVPGEPVHKGQVIAEIENQEYISLQQDYLTASSRIVYLQQELDRQKLLSDEKASPLKIYQQTQAEFNSQRAQAAGLARKLQLIGIDPGKLQPENIRPVIEVHSPIDGFVSQTFMSRGRYVSPTDVLMELVNTSDIHAVLTVFEQDIPRIRTGAAVSIRLPSAPGKIYAAKIILIGQMLDSNHSVLVHCHFQGPDPHLLPNMFLQATIRSLPQSVQAVPDEALVSEGGQQYLFLADTATGGTRFSLVPVKTGVSEKGWNETTLLKPELANRTFVLKGAFSILSAMKNTGEDAD